MSESRLSHMRLEQDLGTEEQGMFIDRTCKTNWTLSDSGAAIHNAIVGLRVDHRSQRWRVYRFAASADATFFSQIDYRFAPPSPCPRARLLR